MCNDKFQKKNSNITQLYPFINRKKLVNKINSHVKTMIINFSFKITNQIIVFFCFVEGSTLCLFSEDEKNFLKYLLLGECSTG